LRIKDVDLARREVLVRGGKRAKDRMTGCAEQARAVLEPRLCKRCSGTGT
jgi:site-specific recombinase XerD